MTLQRWHELECGIEGNRPDVTISVERDDNGDGKPFQRIQYPTAYGYVDRSHAIPDREKGALKRLDTIMARYPGLSPYVQGDPRGCALYVIRPGDVPAGQDTGAYYNHGVAVTR